MDGVDAVVEWHSNEPESERDALLAEMVTRLRGKPIEDEREVPNILGFTVKYCQENTVYGRVLSGIRTAVVQLQCLHDGRNMTEALGGRQKESVQLYANLNRYLRDVLHSRTPKDFGNAAGRAAKDGFTILKTDPFDEVRRDHGPAELKESAKVPLERLAAMRAAAGPNVALQVDAHGGFSLETAPIIAEMMEEYGVTWFEDPIAERPKPENLAKLKGKVRIPIASGGEEYEEAYFEELVTVGQVAYTMQDVMRCGGVGVAARVGQFGAKHGVKTSCHSPTGPLSSLASAHVHAASPGSHALEFAPYENDWRADLIEPRERVEGGRLYFPGGAGLGATLRWDTVEKHGGRRWRR